MMRKLPVCLLLLALSLNFLPSTPTQARVQSFTEGFDTSTYQDVANTTAHWDTFAGRLKLPITEPIPSRLFGARISVSGSTAVYVPELERAYVIGGLWYYPHPPPRSATIWQYDPARHIAEYAMNAALPTGRDSCVAAYASAVGKIYIFGGEDWDQSYKDIFKFDPFADTLTVLPIQLPYRLHDAAAVYVPSSNKVYIFGGVTPDRISPDILCFDVA
ncbi:MAG: hypothetical protein FJ026_09380, partial [Chloroflexi bacterium]|nr:hypothetical protein [Chloroflexota bacterium]